MVIVVIRIRQNALR